MMKKYFGLLKSTTAILTCCLSFATVAFGTNGSIEMEDDPNTLTGIGDDLLSEVFGYLGLKDYGRLSGTCWKLKKVANMPHNVRGLVKRIGLLPDVSRPTTVKNIEDNRSFVTEMLMEFAIFHRMEKEVIRDYAKSISDLRSPEINLSVVLKAIQTCVCFAPRVSSKKALTILRREEEKALEFVRNAKDILKIIHALNVLAERSTERKEAGATAEDGATTKAGVDIFKDNYKCPKGRPIFDITQSIAEELLALCGVEFNIMADILSCDIPYVLDDDVFEELSKINRLAEFLKDIKGVIAQFNEKAGCSEGNAVTAKILLNIIKILKLPNGKDELLTLISSSNFEDHYKEKMVSSVNPTTGVDYALSMEPVVLKRLSEILKKLKSPAQHTT